MQALRDYQKLIADVDRRCRRIVSRYRGHRTIGFCEKNFQHLSPIPEDDAINLAHLNSSLAAVNQGFVSHFADRWPPDSRFSLSEALLMKLPSST